MPMVQRSSGEPGFVIDRSTHSIRLQRSLDAPPEIVFEAWTSPAHLKDWWDPSGQPLAVCKVDLRPGGAFTFVSKGRPDMPFSGVYIEIIPAKRLTFEALGATGRVKLEKAGEGTRLLVEIQCSSAEHLEQFLREGVSEGTSATLDHLVEHLRSSTR